MSPSISSSLVGPICKRPLRRERDTLTCGCNVPECPGSWPLVDGVPSFLPPEGSFEDDYTVKPRRPSTLAALVGEHAFRLRHDILRRERERLGRKLDVLDVGSGGLLGGTGPDGGRHFNTLRTFARSYCGVEPSEHMVHHVNRPDGNIQYLSNARLVRGVGEALPLPPQSCDVAFLLAMLDHTVDPQAVLSEVRSTLRAGGKAIITLRNMGSWHRRLLRRVAPTQAARREARDHHTHTWTPDSFGQLLESASFRIAERHDYGYLWVPRPDVGRPLLWLGEERALAALAWAETRIARRWPGRGAHFCVVGEKH